MESDSSISHFPRSRIVSDVDDELRSRIVSDVIEEKRPRVFSNMSATSKVMNSEQNLMETEQDQELRTDH